MADIFAAFVEALSAALDDHELTGDQLAGRLHLSRFHVDRVVAATAGESPARLRRRVLLERAAYRLATSRLTILDIAVEAGYSSHEAFTRAFTRAYRSSPVAWRRRPHGFWVDAPNGVHFHPPASLRLPAPEKASPMELLVRMVEHNVWLIGELLNRAATLDDAWLDTPVPGEDTTPRALLSRLVGQLHMWSAAIAGEDYDFAVEQAEALDHARARLAEVGPAFVSQVREICEQGRLEEALLCPGEPVEVYTFGGMIAHVLTYAAHRRTVLTAALSTAGVDVDDDPIRWVAA